MRGMLNNKASQVETDLNVTKQVQPFSIQTESFSFNNYYNQNELQTALERLFPVGATVEDVDRVLVGEGKAFRSDNLIPSFQRQGAGHFSKGTSTDKNYVFYFKPHEPHSKTIWKEATDGWVVKLVHGNLPAPSDTKFDRMLGGSRAGLKEIHALAVPNIQNHGDVNEAVKLVKELLQYQQELQEVDNFDREIWQVLSEKHKASPCLKEFTHACLNSQFMSLTGFPKPIRMNYYTTLAHKAMTRGDQVTAKTLLDVWPTEAEVRAYEEGYSRLRRHSDEVIESVIRVQTH